MSYSGHCGTFGNQTQDSIHQLNDKQILPFEEPFKFVDWERVSPRLCTKYFLDNLLKQLQKLITPYKERTFMFFFYTI
jgi:hypothetical protein